MCTYNTGTVRQKIKKESENLGDLHYYVDESFSQRLSRLINVNVDVILPNVYLILTCLFVCASFQSISVLVLGSS